MTDELQDQDLEGFRPDPTAEFLELYSHNYPRLQYYLMAHAADGGRCGRRAAGDEPGALEKVDTYKRVRISPPGPARSPSYRRIKTAATSKIPRCSATNSSTLAEEAANERFAQATSPRLAQCLKRFRPTINS